MASGRFRAVRPAPCCKIIRENLETYLAGSDQTATFLLNFSSGVSTVVGEVQFGKENNAAYGE